jgi:hypothetical protein
MILAAAIVILAGATGPVPCASAGDATPRASRGYHVRALDPRVQYWIETGASHSSTFSDLLGRLTTSDVIVYVELVDRISSGADGQTLFVGSTATVRYVRIQLKGPGRAIETIALLGHELQHAVEIANAPQVRDSRALARLYLRPDGSSRSNDSAAARDAGARIRNEIAFHTEADGQVRCPSAPGPPC